MNTVIVLILQKKINDNKSLDGLKRNAQDALRRSAQPRVPYSCAGAGAMLSANQVPSR